MLLAGRYSQTINRTRIINIKISRENVNISAFWTTCSVGKYVIIEASNQPASGRNSDTLIRLKNRGGLVSN